MLFQLFVLFALLLCLFFACGNLFKLNLIAHLGHDFIVIAISLQSRELGTSLSISTVTYRLNGQVDFLLLISGRLCRNLLESTLGQDLVRIVDNYVLRHT